MSDNLPKSTWRNSNGITIGYRKGCFKKKSVSIAKEKREAMKKCLKVCIIIELIIYVVVQIHIEF